MSYTFKPVPSNNWATALGISDKRVKEIAESVGDVLIKAAKDDKVTIADIITSGAALAETPEELAFISYKLGGIC